MDFSMDSLIVDVREKDEFDAEHIEGCTWIPLSAFSRMAPGILQAVPGKKIILMCRS